jgi:hypothetical protein
VCFGDVLYCVGVLMRWNCVVWMILTKKVFSPRTTEARAAKGMELTCL